MQPALINREEVQEILGGISRTTFYKKRKKWEQQGTPFPDELKEYSYVKGGMIYRKCDVINFCEKMGFI